MDSENAQIEMRDSAKLKPTFGDILENGWASDRNPTKRSIYLGTGHRSSGPYFKMTDGKGHFWEQNADKYNKLTKVGTIFDAQYHPTPSKKKILRHKLGLCPKEQAGYPCQGRDGYSECN